MEFQALVQRAVDVRRQYTEFEEGKYGRAWTREEVLQGFIGDVGDLVKLSMACSGTRRTASSQSHAKWTHGMGKPAKCSLR